MRTKGLASAKKIHMFGIVASENEIDNIRKNVYKNRKYGEGTSRS